MPNPGCEKYGKFYWCIGTDQAKAKDGEIYVFADSAYVAQNGELILRGNDGMVNLALAAGRWRYVFAASCLDGSPIAAMHWKGQIS